MSYQVFARKYRPQTFDDVVGQEHITRTLRNAIEQNRLAHAYLFVGPRGTGKTSTARIVAKALNCTNGPNANFDPDDDICREIAEGRCMDVLEIDGASNNSVEQIRELRDNVRFAPSRGQYKVYIIDEVHMLTSAAFNALLKTLEEPPSHVKFIFATTEPQKVLPTILSRCQRFDLRRIPAQLIAGHLQFIAGKENLQLSDAAAAAIAIGADGGLRDAESMLDQLVAFCGDTIEEDDVLSVFGFPGAQTISELASAIVDGEIATALRIVNEQSDSGKDLLKVLADLIGHLRNVLVWQVDPEGVAAELTAGQREAIERHAAAVESTRVLDLIDQLATAEGRIKWAANKKLHLEIAIIKAVQTLQRVTLDDVIHTLTDLREGREPTPRAAAPAPAPAARPRPAPRRADAPAPVNIRPKAGLRAALEAELEVSPKPAKKPALPEPKPESVVQETPTPKPEPAPPVAEKPEPPTPELEPAPAPVLPTAPSESRSPDDPVLLSKTPVTATATQPPTVVQEKPAAVAHPESASDDRTLMNEAALGKLWLDLMKATREKVGLHGVLVAGRIISCDGEKVIIAFSRDNDFQMKSLLKTDRAKQLSEILSDILGCEATFETKIQDGIVPMAVPQELIEEDIAAPNAEWLDDPLIKEALALFKAELAQTH